MRLYRITPELRAAIRAVIAINTYRRCLRDLTEPPTESPEPEQLAPQRRHGPPGLVVASRFADHLRNLPCCA